MGILQDITPLNLQEEKEKFLQDLSYNPQFTYKTQVAKERLTSWGEPKEHIFLHAKKMVGVLFEEYHQRKKLPLATESQIQEEVNAFFEQLPSLQTPMLVFTVNQVAKCLISDKGLSFKKPIVYKHDEVTGVIYHELGTHWLRNLNQKGEAWMNLKRPDPIFRKTEEGLAILHTYLGSPNQSLFHTFSLYCILYYGYTHSFAETFAYALELGIEKKRAWRVALRIKRGLEDTSQPGGFTKDIAYLEGAIETSRWLLEESNNPHDLYIGKVGTAELEERLAEHSGKELLIPPFMRDIEKYRENIRTISQKGQFDAINS